MLPRYHHSPRPTSKAERRNRSATTTSSSLRDKFTFLLAAVASTVDSVRAPWPWLGFTDDLRRQRASIAPERGMHSILLDGNHTSPAMTTTPPHRSAEGSARRGFACEFAPTTAQPSPAPPCREAVEHPDRSRAAFQDSGGSARDSHPLPFRLAERASTAPHPSSGLIRRRVHDARLPHLFR